MSNQFRDRRRSSVQRGASVAAVVLLAFGLLGFVPGITQPYDGLKLATDSSTAELFGVFQTSWAHNLVHVVTGVVGLFCIRTPLRARNYLLLTGLGYLALFLYGILVFRRDRLNFLPINNPDNILHLVIAVTLVACSVLLNRGQSWRRVVERGQADI